MQCYYVLDSAQSVLRSAQQETALTETALTCLKTEIYTMVFGKKESRMDTEYMNLLMVMFTKELGKVDLWMAEEPTNTPTEINMLAHLKMEKMNGRGHFHWEIIGDLMTNAKYEGYFKDGVPKNIEIKEIGTPSAIPKAK